MGEVIRLSVRSGAGNEHALSLEALRRLAGTDPREFAAAIASEAREPLPVTVYLAYEDGEPVPAAILAAARRVAARTADPAAARGEQRQQPGTAAVPPQLGAERPRALYPPGHIEYPVPVTGADGPAAAALWKGDEVEYAAREAEADQLVLLSGTTAEAVTALWDEVSEIARSTSRSPREVFSASKRIRYRAVRLAANTRRPGVLSDLYVVAGQSTALMASTAFDLNRWEAASSLARSAVSFGEMGGSPSLEAWTLGLAATLANWRNEPDAALSHFQRGLQVAPTGAPRVRLRYIAARSLALLGDHAAVADVLNQARRDQDDADSSRDTLSDEVGGEFAFGRARAEACAAAAWLDLGDGFEAKQAAQRALAALTSLPQGRQPLSQVAGARIDLATACLLGHELDEAEETLKAVFDTPGALRNVSLSGRLTRARKVLASGYPLNDGAARSLDEAIGSWLAGRS